MPTIKSGRLELKSKTKIPARITPKFAMMSLDVKIWLETMWTSLFLDLFKIIREAVFASRARKEIKIMNL